jgi:hypothetical protein
MPQAVALNRIKHDGKVYLPGDDFDASVTEDEASQLLTAGVICTREYWDALHPPEQDDLFNPNAPSNMFQIEGTALAAGDSGVGDSQDYKEEKGSDDDLRRTLMASANPNPKQQTRMQKLEGNKKDTGTGTSSTGAESTVSLDPPTVPATTSTTQTPTPSEAEVKDKKQSQ